MTDTTIKTEIQDAMKTAMRARDSARLGVIRLILSEIKQVEVDERIELDNPRILVILDKMLKTRRDAAKQFFDAKREDLYKQEQFEISIIQSYMPTPLSEDEINNLIKEAVTATNASSIKDMGKVMGILKPKLQGRADMGVVSSQIKELLAQ